MTDHEWQALHALVGVYNAGDASPTLWTTLRFLEAQTMPRWWPWWLPWAVWWPVQPVLNRLVAAGYVVRWEIPIAYPNGRTGQSSRYAPTTKGFQALRNEVNI